MDCPVFCKYKWPAGGFILRKGLGICLGAEKICAKGKNQRGPRPRAVKCARDEPRPGSRPHAISDGVWVDDQGGFRPRACSAWVETQAGFRPYAVLDGVWQSRVVPGTAVPERGSERDRNPGVPGVVPYFRNRNRGGSAEYGTGTIRAGFRNRTVPNGSGSAL